METYDMFNMKSYYGQDISFEESITRYNNLINQFNRFLATMYTKDDVFTHVRVGDPGGKYNIQNPEEFLKYYKAILQVKEIIKNKYKNNFNDNNKKLLQHYRFNFAEKPKDIGPYMSDYDFEFELPANYDSSNKKKLKHYYTPDDIKLIVEVLNQNIYKYFDIEKKDIKAYICEKPRPTVKEDKKIIKDGFHICYILPFTKEQREFIFNETKNYFKNKNLLAHMNIKNSYDQVFDDINKSCWMMYHSYKTIGDKTLWQVYSLSYVYNFDLELCKSEYNKYQLIKFFSIRQYDDNDPYLTFREMYTNINLNYRLNKFDPNLFNRTERPNNDNEIQTLTCDDFNNSELSIYDEYKWDNIKGLEYDDIKNKIMSKNIDMNELYIHCLLCILNIRRYEEYSYWIKICWILKNTSEKYFNLFIYHSKKASNFDFNGCKKAWNSAKTVDQLKTKNNKVLTFKTLIMFANEDNHTEQKNITVTFTYEQFVKSLSCYDNDIAELCYQYWGHNHICTNTAKNQQCWYVFKNHRWVENKNGEILQDLISNELCDIYKKSWERLNKQFVNDINSKYTIRNLQCEEEGNLDNTIEQSRIYAQQRRDCDKDIEKTQKERQRLQKQYSDIIKKLRNSAPLEGVMRACQKRFSTYKYFSDDHVLIKTYKTFESILDTNQYLIGFDNGVYDLQNFTFRDGRPDDFISLSVNYNYIPYDPDNQIYEQIMKYFQNLFLNENVREYMFRYLASRLEGANHENFELWTGNASNGKSVFTALLKTLYGDYYGTVEHTLITRPRCSSNNATPELCNTKGKRFITLSEPGANDRLNVSIIKQLSGGSDIITARNLFQSPIYFRPQFEMALICNQKPSPDSLDAGFRRRLHVVDFNTQFVNHKPIKPNQVQADKRIAEFINNGTWAPYIMTMLINKYWKIYYENKYALNPPKEVLESSDDYITSNNIISEFLDDKYIVSDKFEEPVIVTEFYKTFKDWLKSNYRTSEQMNKCKFIEHIKHNFKDLVFKKDKKVDVVIGIMLKEDYEDLYSNTSVGISDTDTPGVCKIKK